MNLILTIKLAVALALVYFCHLLICL